MSNFTKLMQQAASGVGGGSFYDYEIENSLRFNTGNTDYLTFTPSTNGNNTTFTLRFMVKLCNLDKQRWLFLTNNNSPGSAYTGVRFNATNTLEYFNVSGGATAAQMITSSVFRDVSSWYDIVISVSSTNVDIYVNGVEQPYGTVNQPNGESTGVNSFNNLMSTSFVSGISGGTLDGYVAEMVLVDGQAPTPTSFGEFKNGIWVPKDCSGLSFGTNGAYLKFENSGALGTDSSGNSNNWTVNGLTSSDQMIDTPTNNFATFNPLVKEPGITNDTNTYAEGNLYAKGDASANYNNTQTGVSTILYPSSGAWYTEVRHSGFGGQFNVDTGIVGVYTQDAQAGWAMTTNSVMYYFNGSLYVSGSVVQTGGATYTTGDIIGVFVDSDNNQIKFYKNGSLQYTYNSSVSLGGFKLLTGDGASTEWVAWILNAGQNGTFNGNVTAGGNTDANGIGDFKYTVPTDALALCTANLPEPTIGPNSDTTSDENFDTVLFNKSTAPASITGLEFQPDIVWTKNRDNAYHHVLFDAVRGASSGGIYPSSSDYEDFFAVNADLASFDTNGFTIGSTSSTNVQLGSNVGWTWKANGSGSSNTDGSITSTVSANQDAGISIVTYTGTGSSMTFGHGLGQPVDFMLVKKRDTADGWVVHPFSVYGTSYILSLNSNIGIFSDSVCHTNNSTVIGFTGASGARNLNGGAYVAYCFAEVESFSSFGSYTGNGSATDGPFVFTGFKPAFVIFKRTDSTSDWNTHDASRSPYNVSDDILWANLSDAETTGSSTGKLDFLSNGIKIRGSANGINTSGGTYIYMAFAENPFKNALAR